MNFLNRLSNLYYQLKGLLFYKAVFRQFGFRSSIRKPILISNPRFISIADHVSVREGVRLEAIQTNPLRIPQLTIGSRTNIEQNVHIVCHSRVFIGNGVSITAHCAIVDVTHPYDNVNDPIKIGFRIKDENSFVEIGDGAFLGYGCVVLPNVRIGMHSVIGANSVVTDDVPDYAVAVGAPATVTKQYDFSINQWVRVGAQ